MAVRRSMPIARSGLKMLNEKKKKTGIMII
jgi:hypothetical protein